VTSGPPAGQNWPKLREYDLYQLARPAAVSDRSIRACAELPYAALPPGTQPPAGWEIVAVRNRYRGDRIKILQGLDWLIGHQVDVINLSLGFHGKPDAADPLHVATRTAAERGISVVVAAGNDGPSADSIQELARDPWVISVGATDSAGQLQRYSSRGSPLAAGPTVVADGTPGRLRQDVLVDFANPHPDGQPTVRSHLPANPGSSFATPRVANAMIFIRKMLEITWALHRASRQDTGRIVAALPTVGIADEGIDPDFLNAEDGPYRGQLRASGQERIELPVRDAARDWFAGMVTRLAAAGLPLDDQPQDQPGAAAGPGNPPWLENSRRLLCAAATPVAGAQPWEAGAGLIARDAVRDYFRHSFTPSAFLDAFFPGAREALAASDLSAIDRDLGTPWSDRDIEFLDDVFSTGVFLAVARVM
jgi:hypothetical protein